MSRTKPGVISLLTLTVMVVLKLAEVSSSMITFSALSSSVKEIIEISKDVESPNDNKYNHPEDTKAERTIKTGYITFISEDSSNNDRIDHAFKVQMHDCGEIPQDATEDNLVCMKQKLVVSKHVGNSESKLQRADVLYYTPSDPTWYYLPSCTHNRGEGGKLIPKLVTDDYVNLPDKKTIDRSSDESIFVVIPFKKMEDIVRRLSDMWQKAVLENHDQPLKTETLCFYEGIGSKEFKMTLSFNKENRKIHIKEQLFCLVQECEILPGCIIFQSADYTDVYFDVDSQTLMVPSNEDDTANCKLIRPESSPNTHQCKGQSGGNKN